VADDKKKDGIKGGGGGGGKKPPRDMGNTEQRDLKGSQGKETKETTKRDK
jgi:hypothetical protein